MDLPLLLICLAFLFGAVHVSLQVSDRLFGEYGEFKGRGRRWGIWIALGSTAFTAAVVLTLVALESSWTLPIAVALGAITFGVVLGCVDESEFKKELKEIEDYMRRQERD